MSLLRPRDLATRAVRRAAAAGCPPHVRWPALKSHACSTQVLPQAAVNVPHLGTQNMHSAKVFTGKEVDEERCDKILLNVSGQSRKANLASNRCVGQCNTQRQVGQCPGPDGDWPISGPMPCWPT
eukprot:366097-Chlamydomonas_euryale.AAC.36